MSKLVKFLVSVALIVVVFSATAEARARHGSHHGGWHGGHHGGWHGGHHGGWRGAGWRRGWGWGYPYYYSGPYYYTVPRECVRVRVRVKRHGHWVLRRVWRCW